jgi:hypothetical protein
MARFPSERAEEAQTPLVVAPTYMTLELKIGFSARNERYWHLRNLILGMGEALAREANIEYLTINKCDPNGKTTEIFRTEIL